MIFNFHGSTDETLSFVKSVLPLMGNIRSFEVFRHQDDSPYFIKESWNETEIETRLPFVLQDDQDNELRLVSLCGYGGGGPQTTEHILQLFGVYTDYGITKKDVDRISKHIHPEEINLWLTISIFDIFAGEEESEKPLFKARLKFEKPGYRLAFLNGLHAFGIVNPLYSSGDNSKYFDCNHHVAFSPKDDYTEDITKVILKRLALAINTDIEFYYRDLRSLSIDMNTFFMNMKTHLKNFPGPDIEFVSRKYPTLRILDHKGYIYLAETKSERLVKFNSLYNIDGFRCCPNRDNPEQILVELTADGGTPFVREFYSLAYDLQLPMKVIDFLTDYKNDPKFIINDVGR